MSYRQRLTLRPHPSLYHLPDGTPRCLLDQITKTPRTLHGQRLSTTLPPFYCVSSSSNHI